MNEYLNFCMALKRPIKSECSEYCDIDMLLYSASNANLLAVMASISIIASIIELMLLLSSN